MRRILELCRRGRRPHGRASHDAWVVIVFVLVLFTSLTGRSSIKVNHTAKLYKPVHRRPSESCFRHAHNAQGSSSPSEGNRARGFRIQYVKRQGMIKGTNTKERPTLVAVDLTEDRELEVSSTEGTAPANPLSIPEIKKWPMATRNCTRLLLFPT